MTAQVFQSQAEPTELSFGVKLKELYQLTKPTITLMVVVTAVPATFMASAVPVPDALVVLFALVGAALASGSAAVFNQVVESESDKRMERTAKRPLASGRLAVKDASIFGVALGAIAFLLLYFGTTPLAAYVAVAGHLFYVCVYTMFLKRRTPQNIVIGGAAGAVGPLIGWAAVANNLPLDAWLLASIIFLWTPPHFWALALKYKDDYASAGIPMYPNVYGDHKTRKAMMLYALSLFAPIIALYYYDAVGITFLVVAVAMTAKFVWGTARIYFKKTNEGAMGVFFFSCLYTFVLFVVLTIERLVVALA